jgi:hypothetical protein
VEPRSICALYVWWNLEVFVPCTIFWNCCITLSCEIDEDIPRLKTVAVSVLSDMGLNGAPLSEDLITEMVHPVTGFIGGVASQEVIKVCYAHLFNMRLELYYCST